MAWVEPEQAKAITRIGDHFSQDGTNLVTNRKRLKINKRLPRIKLPANKVKMFADWWNNDIRFEKSVPHAFEEGYFIYENNMPPLGGFSETIKFAAKYFHTTYRAVETQLAELFELVSNETMYFKFTSDDTVYVEIYDSNDLIISHINFKIGANSEFEPRIDLFDIATEETMDSIASSIGSVDDILNNIHKQHIYLLTTCLWYMATASPSTKYVYEEKSPTISSRHKHVVHVSDTKFITTPIYDMSKVKVTTVEKLVARKRGWSYSHSFQVHGHYRHYKDGRVIFINSYIKGKGKPFKSQTTYLTPEKIKEG